MALPPFTFGHGSSEIFTVTQLAVIVLSLVLLGLSVTAYRNTNLKKTLFAIIIFALFAFQHIINYVDAKVMDIMPDDIRFALFSSVSLAILVLFFVTIVKK